MTKPRRRLPALPPDGYDPTGKIILPGGKVYTAPLGTTEPDWTLLGHTTDDIIASLDAKPLEWTMSGGSPTQQAILKFFDQQMVMVSAPPPSPPPTDSLGYAILFPRDPLGDLAWEWLLDPVNNTRPEDTAKVRAEYEADWADGATPVIAAMRRELRRYTYRDGVTMRVEANDPPPPAYSVHVTGRIVIAAEVGGEKVTVAPTVHLVMNDTPERRRDEFLWALKGALQTLEQFSVRRFLRVDGAPLPTAEVEDEGW